MNTPLVVIPTYNEKDNITPLVEELLSIEAELRVLIVDDNSPDGTGELVRELSDRESRVHALHRPYKMGLGSAYVQAFRKALSMEGISHVCTMDADFSHDPSHLPALLKASEESDVVVGSRYLDGISVVNWPLLRILLSYTANAYARLVTGIPLTDFTSGYCCYRKKVIEALDLDAIKSEGYAFLMEIKYKAWVNGFSFSDVPIVFHERRNGSSKISKHIILEAALLAWKLRLGKILITAEEKGAAVDKPGCLN